MNEVVKVPRRRRRTQSAPTVADVARAAGVSSMTVSRVINGETNVVEATRVKVQDAVRLLGYVPNSAARSLAGGRQCRIALLHSNPSAAYLSEFLVGTLEEASTSDAQLVVEHCTGAESAEALAMRLEAHRIDAVLLPPPLCDDAALRQALHARDMPMVQIATGRPVDSAHAVTIDDEGAAYAMTRHLVARGHRRIGFVSGNANQTASHLRRRGYERALEEAGIPLDPLLVAEGDFTYRSGLAAAEVLLRCEPRPTAIFASNDDMAAAASAVAHRHRLDVPRDLSIVGYDDTPIATTVWPELTTIRQPIQEMARLGTRLLIEAVQHKRAGGSFSPRHECLDFELVPRASDAERA
jgi:LacI family transcriptional regulator